MHALAIRGILQQPFQEDVPDPLGLIGLGFVLVFLKDTKGIVDHHDS